MLKKQPQWRIRKSKATGRWTLLDRVTGYVSFHDAWEDALGWIDALSWVERVSRPPVRVMR